MAPSNLAVEVAVRYCAGALSYLVLVSTSLGTCKGTLETPPIAEGIAIVNGVLIDGTGSAPVYGGYVVFHEGTIIAAGESTGSGFASDVQVIDVQGAAILPGIINAHVHRGYVADNLRAWAREGVTTVRDLGADRNQDHDRIRDELMSDGLNARLIVAGPMLTEPRGYPAVPFGSVYALPVPTRDDARQVATDLLDEGVDLLKVAVERGELFGMEIPTLSDEKLTEIVSVAHRRHRRVSAHILVADDLARALDARVDDIAHMAATVVSDALIARMVAEDVAWVPTLELWQGVGRRHLEVAQGNLRRFVAAGGTVALGTDFAGYTAPFDLGLPETEIALMREAGMTPMQIIVAMTGNAARVCGLGDRLGALEPGMIADILVVDGNPLEDLDDLSNIRMVVQDGRIIRGAE